MTRITEPETKRRIQGMQVNPQPDIGIWHLTSSALPHKDSQDMMVTFEQVF